MQRGQKYLTLLTYCALISGCGGGPTAKQLVFRAPQSHSDSGILVQAPGPEVMRFVGARPTSSVRIINSKHNLYEIYGAPAEDITTHFGAAMQEQNTVEEKPATESFVDLSKCKFEKNQLTAQILEPRKIFKRNELIQYQAQLSAPANLFWGLTLPNGDSQIFMTKQFEFSPKILGRYEVSLLAIDSQENCRLDSHFIQVTDNAPFLPNTAEPVVHRQDFSQLDLIDVERIWPKSTGKGVVIAVIDTGINYNHPLLASQIFINEKEIPDNGIDDDNNGFIDDYLGYDFRNGDPFPYDDTGHGSHVAGLAAAGKIGISPGAKILPIKVMDSLGGDLGSLVGAIYYAIDRGAQIINLSLGFTSVPSPVLLQALNYAADRGVLVVCAGGNGQKLSHVGMNLDQNPLYPASLPLPNIFSVAALDSDLRLTSYSNFGSQTVTVAAPGGTTDQPLRSTNMEGEDEFASLSGTSMAAGLVSGYLSLRLALHPGETPTEIKNWLKAQGESLPQLHGLVAIPVRLSASEFQSVSK